METYTVTVTREPWECGICGSGSMKTVVVTDGTRTRKFRQSDCDNSDPLTAASALEWFLFDEDEWED